MRLINVVATVLELLPNMVQVKTGINAEFNERQLESALKVNTHVKSFDISENTFPVMPKLTKALVLQGHL